MFSQQTSLYMAEFYFLQVYYLKDPTVVGSGAGDVNPDITLQGLGILPTHCVLNIENLREVYITPSEGARYV